MSKKISDLEKGAIVYIKYYSEPTIRWEKFGIYEGITEDGKSLELSVGQHSFFALKGLFKDRWQPPFKSSVDIFRQHH